MPTYATLGQIADAARACTACGLCQGRINVVPGEGPDGPSVLFIGEGPGVHEDRQGRPFVGAAGQLLDEMLRSTGLKRSDVYITNVVKCRPPGNRDPLPEEIAACRPWLQQQIDLIRPRLIVTLGRHAMGMFFPGESITRLHGMAMRSGQRLVMPMYHPAAALYQQSLKQTLQADFAKIPELLRTVQRPALAPAPTPAVQKQETGPQQLSMF